MDNIVQLNSKLEQAAAALQKAAQYVATVQPKVDAYNEMFDKFVKKAHQTVAKLVDHGLVPQRNANTLIDKMAEDITTSLEVIEKISSMIKPASMVEPSHTKIAVDDKSVDPFVRLVFGDGASANTGMID